MFHIQDLSDDYVLQELAVLYHRFLRLPLTHHYFSHHFRTLTVHHRLLDNLKILSIEQYTFSIIFWVCALLLSQGSSGVLRYLGIAAL